MEGTLERPNIKVYIRTDGVGNVTAVASSIFLSDTYGWTEIDEGTGDRFTHAQGNYFDRPLMNDSGICRYKYVNGKISEKTEDEMVEEIDALPAPPPTEAELLRAQLAAISERNEFLEDCIAEMAAMVYK